MSLGRKNKNKNKKNLFPSYFGMNSRTNLVRYIEVTQNFPLPPGQLTMLLVPSDQRDEIEKLAHKN